ncbi:MAG: hypothetical protein ACR2LS_04720 [Thermomicrobiales bacterium]
MRRPPTPFLLVIGAVLTLMLSVAAGPIIASHGTPEAGTPGAGTPGAGTPGAGTPDAGTPDAVAHAAERGVEIPPVARPVVKMVVSDAAANAGLRYEQVEVVQVEAREWPDSSLGCPEEGGFYAQVITPGYLIRVTAADETLEYHTDASGENITLCQPGN